MSFRVTHELHDRRKSRNVGLAVVLLAFVVIVFGITMAKITNDPARAAAQAEENG